MNNKKVIDINPKKVIDLSPKILRGVSILSLVLIICNIIMDITFTDSIKYINIIPLILLVIYCEYFRRNSLKNNNK